MALMYRRLFVLIALLISPGPPGAQEADTESAHWLLSHAGKSTNFAVWDDRFDPWLESTLPSRPMYLGMSRRDDPPSVVDALLEVLGGPPHRVQLVADSIVTLSACRHHSCDEKGYLLYDATTETILAAVGHFFFENEQMTDRPQLLLLTNLSTCSALSKQILGEVSEWRARVYAADVDRVRCLTRAGTLVDPFTLDAGE